MSGDAHDLARRAEDGILPIFQAPLRFIYAINLHPIQPIDQFGFPIDYLKEKKSGFTFSIGRTF